MSDDWDDWPPPRRWPPGTKPVAILLVVAMLGGALLAALGAIF